MPTILLTSPDRDLAEGILRALPCAIIENITPSPPVSIPGGPLWCFVDWLLVDRSGLEMCRYLRSTPATLHAHVTMVLDSDDDIARRRSLSAGADDYLIGPLTVDHVVSRIRWSEGEQRTGSLSHGQLSLDTESHQVRWNGRLIVLSPREISLLGAFLQNPDRLLSRSRLITMVGTGSDIHDERTVDVWVGRLRRSLEAQGVPSMLRTVRSHGYVLDTPELAR